MKTILKRSGPILILFILVAMGCKSKTTDSVYNPNEFTLLVAASNDGEVGPCG